MDQRKIKIILITFTVILIGAILDTLYLVTKKSNNEPPGANKSVETTQEKTTTPEKLLERLPVPMDENGGAFTPAEIEARNKELLEKLPAPPAAEDPTVSGQPVPDIPAAQTQALVLSQVEGKVVDIINSGGNIIVKIDTGTGIVEYTFPAGSTLLVSVGDTVTIGSKIAEASSSTYEGYGKTPEELLKFLPSPN